MEPVVWLYTTSYESDLLYQNIIPLDKLEDYMYFCK